jgi:hypothetical protein
VQGCALREGFLRDVQLLPTLSNAPSDQLSEVTPHAAIVGGDHDRGLHTIVVIPDKRDMPETVEAIDKVFVELCMTHQG